ncbi:calcium/proton exchanger family protein [Coccidioides posadasii C735 delta SOWgp]|uniref:Calcium/proton exchanger family protein n=1 Tax=Coccidioides posadasii (strain C735) TaxID=222929 RepID=C5PI49_COCP7|nr:calcium/proton exchanger family protein [Coccidioides posadasii C735 delta SOWgp]EER24202.1 calcium/proton exchanger family protein [Coccidioides posadasii C735 delta SOWgp]|eukprot:XP_003066347.1 calcium/proton exchanger family protein [Coccidioides posadasii C735 delta SOWgp]
MHIYRRRARNLAWYDEDGEPPTRNPFKKFRTRSPTRRTTTVAARPEFDDISMAEHRKGEAMAGGIQRAEGTDSMPLPSSVGTDGAFGLPPVGESVNSLVPLRRPEIDAASLSDQSIRRRTTPKHAENANLDDAIIEDPEALGGKEDKQKYTFVGQLRATLFNSWINVLLLAVPVGIILHYIHVDPIAVFVVNFVAIIPLAALLGYGTEEIAMRTGETVGGLLNATFGNAVELIVSILALFKNEIVIVKTSLIGSMLSNLLLVMGMSFFLGGINRIEQNFNMTVAQTAASLLALAVGSLIIPTAFHTWSEGTSIILLFVYGCYLFFQLKSHTEMYNKPSEKVEKRRGKVESGDAIKGIAQIGAGISASMGGHNAQSVPIQVPDDEDQEEPELHFFVALFTLAASTALVGVCAEALVSSIDVITTRGHISETFVGLILLPIVGNAAEHATAITVAMKDKMDLSIGVAVGSSMQIALLVLPLIVVIGWIAGKDDMSLYFDGFQIAVLFVAVLLVNYLIQDGKSHWLEGMLLMTLYLIISVAAWFYPAKSERTGSGAS